MDSVINFEQKNVSADTIQFCCFIVGGDLYGIPVLAVQEIIKPQVVTPVPLSDSFIRGLINLRGQIVTSLSLRNLFGLEEEIDDHMNVIVQSDDSLYSLIVDKIGDVITVDKKLYSNTPESINKNVRGFIDGVYKLDNQILISLNLDKILNNSN